MRCLTLLPGDYGSAIVNGMCFFDPITNMECDFFEELSRNVCEKLICGFKIQVNENYFEKISLLSPINQDFFGVKNKELFGLTVFFIMSLMLSSFKQFRFSFSDLKKHLQI